MPLAAASRVGVLQAVSRAVSLSGADIYLFYLPECLAKTESLVSPLHSFCVRSLADFVSDLPEEVLLCAVRACVFIFLVLLLFLRVLVLSLFLLVLLLGLFLRKLLVSFLAVSSLVRLPLLLLLGVLCFLLPLPLLPFRCIVCGVLQLCGLFHIMLLSLPSLRPLLGLLFLSSILSPLRMSHSPLPVVLV